MKTKEILLFGKQIVGGIVLGAMLGCDGGATKQQQQAAAEQRAIEVAETAKVASDQLNARAKELLDILDNYTVAIEGIANHAESAIGSIRRAANGPEAQELRKYSPQKVEEIFGKAVSGQYETFQKVIRSLLERFDDLDTTEKLTSVYTHCKSMDEGGQRTALVTALTTCEKAQGAIEKYQERYRFEAKEQIEQLTACSKTLAPHIQALKDARMNVQAVIGKK